uniref:Uncharacterized protein n=1 Tax=Panagrolaimus davidi TaxID=227884 RepID=A0A914P843_9BILA
MFHGSSYDSSSVSEISFGTPTTRRVLNILFDSDVSLLNNVARDSDFIKNKVSIGSRILRPRKNVKHLPRRSGGASCFDEPSFQNSTNGVDFDVIEYMHDRKVNKKFIVFTSNERKQYYEFTINSKSTNYHCVQCFAQNKRTTIKRTIHDNGSHTFEFNTDEHVCNPIDYLPENQSSLIVKSPNFKFIKLEVRRKMRPYLVVFDAVNKDMCYRFRFDSSQKLYVCLECKNQGYTVSARFIQHNGETSIELGRIQHICEPQKYIPQKL